jgi:hypothetical protein
LASSSLLRADVCAPHAAAGDVAVSGAAFWSLLAGVLALAVAAQYAVIVAGGARGAAHYAHDAWLAARSSAAHYALSAYYVPVFLLVPPLCVLLGWTPLLLNRPAAVLFASYYSLMTAVNHWRWTDADAAHTGWFGTNATPLFGLMHARVLLGLAARRAAGMRARGCACRGFSLAARCALRVALCTLRRATCSWLDARRCLRGAAFSVPAGA